MAYSRIRFQPIRKATPSPNLKYFFVKLENKNYFIKNFILYQYLCYKRVQSLRVHFLFTGQYYTEDYITFTDGFFTGQYYTEDLQMLYRQLEDQQVAPPITFISGTKSQQQYQSFPV